MWGLWFYNCHYWDNYICLAAIILRLSPYSDPNELIGTLKLQVPKDDLQRALIEKKLEQFCKFQLDQLRFLDPKAVSTYTEDGARIKELISRDSLQEFTYLIRLYNKSKVTELSSSLNNIEGLESLRLNFKKQPNKL